MLSLFQKDLTLSCFLSSSVQPGSPTYSPSDWLLYSLGDWFTRSHLSMTHSLSAAPPRRVELVSTYKQHQVPPSSLHLCAGSELRASGSHSKCSLPPEPFLLSLCVFLMFQNGNSYCCCFEAGLYSINICSNRILRVYTYM